MRSMFELLKTHPTMAMPIECENGCGAIIELNDAFFSYKRSAHGGHLMICQCCAAEEGHLHEEDEEPEAAPVCHRPAKKRLR